MTEDHPRWGIEFEWIAVDQAGYVGVFSTEGYGPSPADALREVDRFDAAIDAIDT